MSITIRHAEESDIPKIMAIYESARNFMRARGNSSQWVNGYPSEQLIHDDINKRVSYVGIDADKGIVCVFAFIVGDDPTYAIINGRWLNDKPYGTIHRIASSGATTGIVAQSVKFCISKIDNLRIDTHECNGPMQRAVLKAEFKQCGIIHIADGTPRIAYQLTVE